jgi:formylglycine-generating enzyme required for sulfatase activity
VRRLAFLLLLCVAACGRTPEEAAAPLACLLQPPAEAAPATDGMVLVKGGAFDMGAHPMRPEEGPPTRVTVDDFWIDRTEVTNADFARFVAATGYVTMAERRLDPKAYPGLPETALKPSGLVFIGSDRPGESDPSRWWRVIPGADWRHPTGPDSSIEGRGALPVVQVAWQDAMAYARWLGRDLPTEAEWEYAAQGGKPATRFGWGDAPFDPKAPQANVWQGPYPVLDTAEDGYKAQVAPVGCFPANGLGLHDMAGNVWEWTKDAYGPGPRTDDLAPTPGDPGGREHVIKGGSFLCAPNFCYRYRPAARQPGPTDTGENHFGFRTVLRVKV